MSAIIIDGKQISSDIREELKKEVESLKKQNIYASLAVILVGNDPASVSYVTGKQKALAELGINDLSITLPGDSSEEKLLSTIEYLNNDNTVNGILVQLPLPKHIDANKIINAIKPEKDVDGFHPINAGNMVIGNDSLLPCTPNGIIRLLKRTGIDTNGKKAVVISRSNIVGKPISILLSRKDINCTVTMCHTGTKDITGYTKDADIIIVASGKPNTLMADMVKDNAIIIDVGVNRIPDATKKSGFRLVGDCCFDELKEKASYITPVPGGVGPMTITMLMYNVVKACKMQNNIAV